MNLRWTIPQLLSDLALPAVISWMKAAPSRSPGLGQKNLDQTPDVRALQDLVIGKSRRERALTAPAEIGQWRNS